MPDVCTWTEDEEGTWTTACARLVVFEYRVDEDPDASYCMKCGKRIKFLVYAEEADDDQAE